MNRPFEPLGIVQTKSSSSSGSELVKSGNHQPVAAQRVGGFCRFCGKVVKRIMEEGICKEERHMLL